MVGAPAIGRHNRTYAFIKLSRVFVGGQEKRYRCGCHKNGQRCNVHQEEKEVLMVSFSYAIANPWTVTVDGAWSVVEINNDE